MLTGVLLSPRNDSVPLLQPSSAPTLDTLFVSTKITRSLDRRHRCTLRFNHSLSAEKWDHYFRTPQLVRVSLTDAFPETLAPFRRISITMQIEENYSQARK